MSKGLRYGDAVKLMSMLEDASNGSVILVLSGFCTHAVLALFGL